MSPETELTIREAARQFPAFSPEYLRRKIREGLLPAEKGGTGYKVRRSDLEALPEPRAGRPRQDDGLEQLVCRLEAQGPDLTPAHLERIRTMVGMSA